MPNFRVSYKQKINFHILLSPALPSTRRSIFPPAVGHEPTAWGFWILDFGCLSAPRLWRDRYAAAPKAQEILYLLHPKLNIQPPFSAFSCKEFAVFFTWYRFSCKKFGVFFTWWGVSCKEFRIFFTWDPCQTEAPAWHIPIAVVVSDVSRWIRKTIERCYP